MQILPIQKSFEALEYKLKTLPRDSKLSKPNSNLSKGI